MGPTASNRVVRRLLSRKYWPNAGVHTQWHPTAIHGTIGEMESPASTLWMNTGRIFWGIPDHVRARIVEHPYPQGLRIPAGAREHHSLDHTRTFEASGKCSIGRIFGQQCQDWCTNQRGEISGQHHHVLPEDSGTTKKPEAVDAGNLHQRMATGPQTWRRSI